LCWVADIVTFQPYRGGWDFSHSANYSKFEATETAMRGAIFHMVRSANGGSLLTANWVTRGLDAVGITTGVPQIAADLPHRPTR